MYLLVLFYTFTNCFLAKKNHDTKKTTFHGRFLWETYTAGNLSIHLETIHNAKIVKKLKTIANNTLKPMKLHKPNPLTKSLLSQSNKLKSERMVNHKTVLEKSTSKQRKSKKKSKLASLINVPPTTNNNDNSNKTNITITNNSNNNSNDIITQKTMESPVIATGNTATEIKTTMENTNMLFSKLRIQTDATPNNNASLSKSKVVLSQIVSSSTAQEQSNKDGKEETHLTTSPKSSGKRKKRSKLVGLIKLKQDMNEQNDT